MSVASIGAAFAGSLITGKGSDQAAGLASYIVPRNINTGFSSFDTIEGNIEIDPSIREAQESYLGTISGFRDPINSAFSRFDEGLEDLQGRAGDLRSDFEGNQSAFRDAVLNPLREKIAGREGDLARELSRTGVRGSFKNRSEDSLAIDSGTALSDAEAKVENQRVNRLSEFLDIDANLLKQSLGSETGRIEMLAKLEQLLLNVSSERFDQELKLLGLPAGLTQGKAAGANFLSNAQGLENEANTNLVGEIIGLFGGGGTGGTGGSTGTGNSPTGGDTDGTPF